MTILLTLGAAGPSNALFTFGAPQPLGSNAATDPPTTEDLISDAYPSVAGDAEGNWVAVWPSGDPAVGVIPGDLGQDAVFTRSGDDGRTWTSLALLSSDAATQDGLAWDVATNGQGTWIAGFHASTGEVGIVRSRDAGATWSDPVYIAGLSKGGMALQIAGDASGRWLAVWRTKVGDSLSTSMDVAASRSTDDGLTWSPAAIVPDEAHNFGVSADRVGLATDGSGTWVVAITSWVQVVCFVSHDVGATWGEPVRLGYGSRLGDRRRVDVESDGAGTWLVTWETSVRQTGEEDEVYEDYDVVISKSSNNGVTWSLPTPVGGATILEVDGSRQTPQIQYSAGVWQIIWVQGFDRSKIGIGRDGDLVGVRSLDGGLTWTDPAAINTYAGNDNAKTWPFPWKNLDFLPDFEVAPSGTSVVVWMTTNSLGDKIGNDYDVMFARSHADCPTTPANGCQLPSRPRASVLSIQNPVGGHDSLLWKWKSGAATDPQAFGDPLASSDYVLCIYDTAGGVLRSVFESDAEAATQCRRGGCWSQTRRGFRYKDAQRSNGALASLVLSSREDVSAMVEARADGPALAPPVMPLAMAPSVLVQLINSENHNCWQATFSTAEVNTATLFQGYSD